MATLGEMATGVAHELNQPLSVIKTASRFFMKKLNRNERIQDDILFTMAEEIDSYVDRATKIINHMRQFGRKSDMELEVVQVNEVLRSAFEIFSQQLKVRGIEVIWDLEDNLPCVMADAGRLEQVFINLLINARDAIEEKLQSTEIPIKDKQITLKTKSGKKNIHIEVKDTGSPLTNVRYTSHYRGAIYGFDQTLNNSGGTRLPNKTPIKNLYLAGAWSNPGHGYGGVLWSGIQCFSEIMKEW